MASGRLLLFTCTTLCCGHIDDVDVGSVPAVPEAGTTTNANVATFALNSLLLGDTTRDGVLPVYPKDPAWRSIGFDVDNRTTLSFSPDVCTPTAHTQIDGDDGIDNSWAANLLDLIGYGTGSENLSKDATSLIQTGTWTLQLQITGLPTDPSASATGLLAGVFVSGQFAGAPAFDGATDWPVLPSSLNDHATLASGAVVRFNTVYVNAGTVVMRDATAPLTLPIALLNYFYSDPKPPEAEALTIRIHAPIISFKLSDAASATNGTIAGVLDTQESIDAAVAFGGRLGDCEFPFQFEIDDAADILIDGTNAPNTPCTAISIGLGFTAKLIANPTQVGVEPTPEKNPCAQPDAGLDGGADAD